MVPTLVPLWLELYRQCTHRSYPVVRQDSTNGSVGIAYVDRPTGWDGIIDPAAAGDSLRDVNKKTDTLKRLK
jgi:hypothetical protein